MAAPAALAQEAQAPMSELSALLAKTNLGLDYHAGRLLELRVREQGKTMREKRKLCKEQKVKATYLVLKAEKECRLALRRGDIIKLS